VNVAMTAGSPDEGESRYRHTVVAGFTSGIGIFQIVGASIATPFLWRALPLALPSTVWPFLAVAMALYTVEGIAGLLVLRGSSLGKMLTVLAQLPQVVQVQNRNLAWSFTSAASLCIAHAAHFTGFTFGLGSRFTFFLPQNSSPFGETRSEIAVNLVPLAILFALYRDRKGSRRATSAEPVSP
jgi:hypothetical protein